MYSLHSIWAYDNAEKQLKHQIFSSHSTWCSSAAIHYEQINKNQLIYIEQQTAHKVCACVCVRLCIAHISLGIPLPFMKNRFSSLVAVLFNFRQEHKPNKWTNETGFSHYIKRFWWLRVLLFYKLPIEWHSDYYYWTFPESRKLWKSMRRIGVCWCLQVSRRIGWKEEQARSYIVTLTMWKKMSVREKKKK